MKTALLASVVTSGLVLAAIVYERLFVEKTFGPSAVAALLILGIFFALLLATYLSYDTRHRETFARIWLVGTSTVVSYLVLDITVGFALIEPFSPPLVPDDFRHHKLLPNSFARLQQRDFAYVQRVNNFGLRGEDLTPDKPAGTYRILMLGDSFTMGKGVEDDETFSVRLEALLNRSSAATCTSREFEVLNGGVDSYAPVLSYIQLTRELTALRPDMVVLNLDVSDLIQETVYRQEAVYDAHGAVVAVPLQPTETSMTEHVRDWVDKHLFFTRAIPFYVNELFGYRELTLRSVVTQANYQIVAHTLADDVENRAEQWQNVFDSILRIREFANAQGMEFVLSVYPWPHQVNDTEWMPGRYRFMPEGAVATDKNRNTVSDFAGRNDIPLADLFPTFRAYTESEALFFRHDPHWTPKGHEVMADGLAASLLAHYAALWCPQR